MEKKLKPLAQLPENEPTSFSDEALTRALQAVHVLPDSPTGGWSVRKMGRDRLHEHFSTKEEAVSFAKVVQSLPDSVVIHRPDGSGTE